MGFSVAVEEEFPSPKLTYGWSKYRYVRYEQAPSDTDYQNAVLAGGDIKCKVCEVILDDLFQKGTNKDFDSIIEALEADSVDEKLVEKATTEMGRYVARNKKGCNKLFKDNYLQKGWSITNCTKLAKHQNESTPLEARAPWACAEKRSTIPSTLEMDTYSVQTEAVHYACEAAIGRKRDELGEFLSASFKKTGRDTQSLKDLYELACRKKGKCLERKPSETAEARVEKIEQSFQSKADDYIETLLKEQKQWDKNMSKERELERKRFEEREAKRKAQKSGKLNGNADVIKKEKEDVVEL